MALLSQMHIAGRCRARSFPSVRMYPTIAHLSKGMQGLKPGETRLTAWVKTQRLAAGSLTLADLGAEVIKA